MKQMTEAFLKLTEEVASIGPKKGVCWKEGTQNMLELPQTGTFQKPMLRGPSREGYQSGFGKRHKPAAAVRSAGCRHPKHKPKKTEGWHRIVG